MRRLATVLAGAVIPLREGACCGFAVWVTMSGNMRSRSCQGGFACTYFRSMVGITGKIEKHIVTRKAEIWSSGKRATIRGRSCRG
jgi:hypothetical protein